MQFKVPQFLDIEDKIFGPFTFREFAYLAGGAGLCFTIYKLLGFLLGIVPMLLIAGFVGVLTFYRPNNKPFIFMLESGFKYFIQDKLYIWKEKTATEKMAQKAKVIEVGERVAPVGLDRSKLRDLAWSLDVLDLSKENKGQ